MTNETKSLAMKKRGEIILKKLNELSRTQKFIDEVFPMDSVLIKRELSEEKKSALKTALNEKIKKLIKECGNLIK